MNAPGSDESTSSKSVFELIEAAFPLHPLPEMSLHQAQLADQSMSREISENEWTHADKLDAGRSWKEFSDDELIACDAALSHFDEPSFVYYLPAYLVLALRHCVVERPHPAWPAVGSVVFSVTHRTPYTLGRYKKLNSEQREAVIAFLRYVARCRTDSIASGAHKALTRYWMTDEAAKPLVIIADQTGSPRRK